MKKMIKLAARFLAAALCAIMAVQGSFSSHAQDKLRVSEEYFDYRRLDRKFMSPNEEYVWNPDKEGFLARESESWMTTIDLTLDDINRAPGTIIAEGHHEENPLEYYAVTIPKVLQDGKTSNALNDYGVFEIFHYDICQGMEDTYVGVAQIYIFDKKMLEKNYSLKVKVYDTMMLWPEPCTSIPLLEYRYYSTDFATLEEAVTATSFESLFGWGHFVRDKWGISNVKFTSTEINFTEEEVEKLSRRLVQCNLLERDGIEDVFGENGDSDSAADFYISELFNPSTGALAGQFTYEDGYNGYAFIRPYSNPGMVIAVTYDTICIGVSARPIYDDIESNVDNDIVYIGKYYEDMDTDNQECFELEGESFETVSSDVLDQLLSLLTNPQVNWQRVNAGYLEW